MTSTKYFFLILYYAFARHLPRSSKSKISKNIRYFICKKIFKYCGKNVNIEKGAWFGNGCNLEIGDYSGLGFNCIVQNNISIGENVLMGPNCIIQESKHVFDRTDIPIRLQGATNVKSKVIIKDDVWIGRDVMIIGDKIIEKGSILAARTVLTKNFPEYSIIGGNPSVLIRNRV